VKARIADRKSRPSLADPCIPNSDFTEENPEPTMNTRTSRITAIRKRMDEGYTDKLDGKIAEEFLHRRQTLAE
jgi:hypothetical protein